ncbi:ecdysteroid kinase domain-containing protein [Phthorimaea operculella]|nr:ecdysteroid kinase domain-containing protein [Phthorimaea operculella]
MADAETLLRELLRKIARDHNFGDHELKIKPITSGGANYTSCLFLITVKNKDKKDVELFAKVACIGEKLREVMSAERLYYLEAYFYQKLLKIYKALEIKENVADEDSFVIPKFYGCNTNLYEETVVLENLVALGYGTYSRFVSVDWEHAASSMETLAKLHALSFAYQKENPSEFEQVCTDIVFVEKKNNDATKAFWEGLVARALSVVKEEYRPRIIKFLEDLGDDGIWKFRRPLGTKVIVHGDFRPSNMLYKRRQELPTLPLLPRPFYDPPPTPPGRLTLLLLSRLPENTPRHPGRPTLLLLSKLSDDTPELRAFDAFMVIDSIPCTLIPLN